jgi:hypothetical protein
MELKEFVTETLLSIFEGIEETINRLDTKGAAGTINPHWRGSRANWKKNVEKVDFDVAVTASDKISGSGKAGIEVFSIIKAGGEASKAVEQSTVSKVKFSIPVIFPASTRDAKPPSAPKRRS